MTPGLVTILLLLLVVIILLVTSLKIANEDERFAEFVLGRFAGFRGPGLLFRLLTSKMHRLKIGDTGVVKSAEFVRFGNVDIPLSGASDFRVNDSVRIERFDLDEPRLVVSAGSTTHNCPKCGHSF